MGEMTSVQDRGRARYVTIEREPSLNALCTPLICELSEIVATAQADERVGALVLQGAGTKAFSAGADLEEIRGVDQSQAIEFIDRGQALMSQISDSDIPVLAAIDGWALGGGFELSLACHMRVATTESRFGLPEAKIGCMPGFGGTQRLFDTTSSAFAYRMMLTGQPVSSAEAHANGLLSYAPIQRELFSEEVDTIARQLAEGSREGMRRILQAGRQAIARPGLTYEASLAAAAISSPDGQEGIRSFAERRPPHFSRGTHE